MGKLLLGFILTRIDIEINIGTTVVGLVPSFAGFIAIWLGLLELSGESEHFVKMRPFALGMAIYTGVLYMFGLCGVDARQVLLTELLDIFALAITYYLCYVILLGVSDIERHRRLHLFSDKLRVWWLWMVSFEFLSIGTALVMPVAALCLLAGISFAFVFLFTFNKSRLIYEEKT